MSKSSDTNPFSYTMVRKMSEQPSNLDVKLARERSQEEEDQVLYEDQFCKLTSKELEIKRYHASIESKIVPLGEIKAVYYSQQTTLPGGQALNINDNGWSTLGKIWWALDPLRQMFNSGEKYNVVIDNGDEWRKGFSIIDMNGFGYYLFELIPSTATFYDGLPNEPMSLDNPPLFH